MPWQILPTRSAAIGVVPKPKNGSSTMFPRTEQSRIASATMAIGLTVGWSAKGSLIFREVFKPDRPSANVFIVSVGPHI